MEVGELVVKGFGYLGLASHAPELGLGAGRCQPEDGREVFGEEVTGATQSYGGVGHALPDEFSLVVTGQVLGEPEVFELGHGPGLVSEPGVAIFRAVLGGTTVSLEGEVYGVSGLGILGQELKWAIVTHRFYSSIGVKAFVIWSITLSNISWRYLLRFSSSQSSQI